MSQVVDTETAREFMKETMEKIQEGSLEMIAGELEVKSGFFQERLSTPEKVQALTETDLFEILRHIFCTRRTAKKILEEKVKTDTFKTLISDLLHKSDPVEKRFSNFCDKLDMLDVNIRYDLAGELLHYTFPDRYWLWCRWMWDPKVKTGSLPLVTTSDYSFEGSDPGETYLKIGKALIFVHQVGEAAGFQNISRNLFGTSVFLSCVYVIYAYTVLRMRMTQEFNKVMPGLTEFSRRILGVHHLKPVNN
ncbi:MAG: hypothetical protein DWQ02_22000 [Bacteroidetes bacterium]|nr:MAG: hypothetical protein DWQ02_22000 [Bacteroidota bacterium]